jgi:glutamine phosphoribosylpyrophosphate amidotransferase
VCEIFAVSWPTPRPFTSIAGWARLIEHYGQGHFGWGVAWLDGDEVKRYRNPGRMATDPEGVELLDGVSSSRFLVHFRRPSKLSTIGLPDSQPFIDDAGSLAFVHNGGFANEKEFRPRYTGRLAGLADSEVGWVMLQDLIATGVPVADGLAMIHAKLGGTANLVTLDNRGTFTAYCGYPGNRFWQFRLDDAQIFATQLHSADDSLFDLVFHGATDRSTFQGALMP